MSAVKLVARLVLMGVFLVSGLTKLVDPSGTRAAAGGFGVPARWQTWVARGLPAAELVVAGLLAWSGSAWWGAVGAMVLLAAFSVAIAVNLGHNRRPVCHCFGQLSAAPIDGRSLVRNAVIAAPAVLLVIAG